MYFFRQGEMANRFFNKSKLLFFSMYFHSEPYRFARTVQISLLFQIIFLAEKHSQSLELDYVGFNISEESK